MTKFIYNRYSSQSRNEQWINYLQDKEFYDNLSNNFNSFIKDYNQTAQSTLGEISQKYEDTSEEVLEISINNTKEIIGSIEDATEKISDSLDDINFNLVNLNDTIQEFAVGLDWRLTELIDQQRINNILNKNIAELLKIPDFQKERHYYIQQGFKHYINAKIDEDLYIDALNNLLEAEKREKTDYVVLHRIGMIYLYSTNSLNIEKAANYFAKAGKYAIVEANEKAVSLVNVLNLNLSKDFSISVKNKNSSKYIASLSFFQASISYYLLNNIEKAVEFSKKSFKAFPKNLEAGFNAARFSTIQGDTEKAKKYLTDVIAINRFYAPKVLTYNEMNTSKEILKFLEDLSLETNNRLKAELDFISQKYMHFLPKEEIKKYEVAVQFKTKATFLDAKKGLDITKKILNDTEQIIQKSEYLVERINKYLELCDEESIVFKYFSENTLKLIKENPFDTPKYIEIEWILFSDLVRSLHKREDCLNVYKEDKKYNTLHLPKFKGYISDGEEYNFKANEFNLYSGKAKISYMDWVLSYEELIKRDNDHICSILAPDSTGKSKYERAVSVDTKFLKYILDYKKKDVLEIRYDNICYKTVGFSLYIIPVKKPKKADKVIISFKMEELVKLEKSIKDAKKLEKEKRLREEEERKQKVLEQARKNREEMARLVEENRIREEQKRELERKKIEQIKQETKKKNSWKFW